MRLLNWGLVAAIVANIVVWACIVSAVAEPLPAHPWRCYTRVCVIVGDAAPDCASFSTRATFDDKEKCLKATEASLDILAADIQKRVPNSRIEAQYLCKPDLKLTNA